MITFSSVDPVGGVVGALVVAASAITDIDDAAAAAVRELLADLAQRRVTLLLAPVRPELEADLVRHHLAAALGPGRIFPTLHEALAVVPGGTSRLHHDVG